MTELAVLVPVLNRPGNVASLVESFLTGCPEDSILLFISNVEEDDPDEARALHQIWLNGNHRNESSRIWWRPQNVATTWPEKINYGAKWITADFSDQHGWGPAWFLLAADDITFTPGWWEATKELRDDPSIGVIGTNDSTTGHGNPRVAAGEHTCHPLVRASYVRDRGTIDEPGKAVHDKFHHWFVDNELVWTARLRGAWAFCRDAMIEHHHPYWDSSIPWDDTYALGEKHNQEDAELWRDRATRLLGLQLQ